MDIVLIILGVVFLCVGLIGCIAPVLPGPPASYFGLLFLHWTAYAHFSATLLWTLAILVILVTAADYIFPIWITQKAGGSKYGVRGATIGLVVGLFGGLYGVILCPFIGAFLGELLFKKGKRIALKSAIGSFIGFLLSTGLKFMLCGVIGFYFIKGLFQ